MQGTFYVHMTVHHNRLKWIKPTDALNSNFIGMTTLHVSGGLSAHHQEFWAVRRLWHIMCSCGDRMLPGVGCRPTPGSIRSPQLHIMYQNRRTAQNSWWWAESLSKTCRVVIPIKLEFSASVGFIHFNNARKSWNKWCNTYVGVHYNKRVWLGVLLICSVIKSGWQCREIF
jgi:hypothetical protein